MPKSGANISLTSYDDIFTTEESRQTEQIQQIPITDLHPFKVLDDEAMQRTVESVAQFGVLARSLPGPERKEVTRSYRGTGGNTRPSWPG